ncbi:LysR family transcriptional regulator [Miniphocaeibacter halophilus]|uniref:LysR family transcriptional regulator n=1 Tax=Miniphocaeibacter halophilus TaxID=2931922 RepID=A0AC61MQ04_9FIRM|nr:LysR family transcriptional regulator [Miniphocaeibacter halophilus]QQK06989.1 LysR family transcriptional regulator [Miniphocaeibacter halophilus]
MTLQQLKYIVKVAEKGSINEAAKELFISQPSLSNAIKELEKELQFAIFIRNNRGVVLTNKGTEFLGYAQQVLTQADLLEAKYIKGTVKKQRFAASSQHYLFVANAFVDLVKDYSDEEYDFTLNETTTYEVIEHVKTMYSEIGIIYLSNYNEAVIRKMLSENNLIFKELFTAKPHVFLSKKHPLANKNIIEIAELDDYPKISFNQGMYNSFYFSEEVFSYLPVKKSIRVSDRAAVVNFMIGLDAYTYSSGVFPEYLHGGDIISVPVKADEKIQVGTIVHKDVVLSEIGKKFYDILLDYSKGFNS